MATRSPPRSGGSETGPETIGRPVDRPVHDGPRSANARPPGQLSARRDGEEWVAREQQRTAVARALVLQPALLADEPTGHQDEGWMRGVLRVLRMAAGPWDVLPDRHPQHRDTPR